MGNAFSRLVNKMGRDSVAALLAAWNDSQLSEDGTRIHFKETRSGVGKMPFSRREFFEWLLSDKPTDPSEHAQEPQWVERVRLAREIASES